jgi:5-methylthioribose kinase
MTIMLKLNPENTVDYLRARGAVSPGAAATAELLEWGVSNVVLRVTRRDGEDLVIKQSREKLRTRAEWRSRLERIYREAEVQRALADLLPAGRVPRVLFEDRPNYLFAMQAVEADHVVWKADLLAGRCDEAVATAAAHALARVHGRTAGDPGLRSRWNDATVFDELRLDPYYRFTAQAHPEIADRLHALIAETLANRVCLVLGDFSPKNILLTRRGIALVDFETGHFGDPAFDLGFFLSHLLLKTILHGAVGRVSNPSVPSLAINNTDGLETRPTEYCDRVLNLAKTFWREYLASLEPPPGAIALSAAEISRRTVPHLAGCLLARIDGKSPVDYLDEARQDVARQFALGLFRNLPPRVEDTFDRLLQ